MSWHPENPNSASKGTRSGWSLFVALPCLRLLLRRRWGLTKIGFEDADSDLTPIWRVFRSSKAKRSAFPNVPQPILPQILSSHQKTRTNSANLVATQQKHSMLHALIWTVSSATLHSLDQHFFQFKAWERTGQIELGLNLKWWRKKNEGDQIERGSRASVFDHNTEPNQHKIRTHNKTTSFLMTPPYHTPRIKTLRAGWDGKIKVITWNPFSFRQNGIEKHQLIKCLI